jgi:hypothetical protein
MKRLYDFITKANQVLFFVALLAVISGIVFLVYQSSSKGYQPPHVPVAQTPEEVKTTIVEDVRFLGQASGIYVFGVVQRAVAPPGNSKIMGAVGRTYSSGSDENGQIVNVVFSKGEKRIKTLLAHAGLVLEFNLSGRPDYSGNLKSHLFLCVTEDTDGNHVLDKKDRNDLYIISGSLKETDLVIPDVSSYVTFSPTRIMVKTGEPQSPRFWDVDTEAQTKKEVIWK